MSHNWKLANSGCLFSSSSISEKVYGFTETESLLAIAVATTVTFIQLFPTYIIFCILPAARSKSDEDMGNLKKARSCVCLDRRAVDERDATVTEKRCEEKWPTCCASFGYVTPPGPYSNLCLNLSLHLRCGEWSEEGQDVQTLIWLKYKAVNADFFSVCFLSMYCFSFIFIRATICVWARMCKRL